ncbi:MAG: tetratricopeptide repeat protein [Alphaproteobacteria bacterium]|nr:tetratricopeptide repeat protein [Alphaproteobacteria bacterium]
MRVDDLLRQAVEALRGGRIDEVRRICITTLSHIPFDTRFHRLLGIALFNQGDVVNAVLQFRRLVVVDPAEPSGWSLLLRGLASLGDAAGLDRASVVAARVSPGDPMTFVMRSRLASSRGDHATAIASARQAIALRPDDHEALFAWGLALQNASRFDESIPAWHRALLIQSRDAATWTHLGISEQRLGRLSQAETAYQRTIVLEPATGDCWANLGAAFYQQNRFRDAKTVLSLAARVQPGNHLVYNNLGLVLGRLSDPSDAILAFLRSVSLRPDLHEAFVNMAQAHLTCGEAEQALAMNGIARRLSPDDAHCVANELMYLNYDPEMDPASVAERHRQWARRFADPLMPAARPPVAWDGERRLRIGYVSADFWWHSVSYFFEPLLDAHDRSRFEIVCYSDARQNDIVAERLRAKADSWRVVVGRTDSEVAEMIRADGIDVLVDLGGHTADNRLLVFARHPAPAQVTWLGYPHSTGMKAMDFRVTDAIADPAPRSDAWSSERLVRLPGGFLCYRPHVEVEPAADPPSLAAGHVTFGSFNNIAKLSERLLASWAEILVQVEGARLVLKGRGFGDPRVAARHYGFFERRGVDPGRLSLVTYTGSQFEHMRAYDGIDIALDSFPYNGTTTTCEALWMGVPVVTVLGRSHAGRVGASLLSQLGLFDLIATDEADYARVAVRLAGDPARIALLRRGLRQRMRASTLCDAAFLARKLETAYVEMLLQSRDGG